jgi:hypothetical protein
MFQSIGLQQVVVQWTLYDNRAFYSTTAFAPLPHPPLEIILELAEARGIELYLGLAAESRYWEMIKQPPQQLEEYLKLLRWRSEHVAQEVAKLARGYRLFKGWYIPEEIDDLTWRPAKERELLHQHIKQLSAYLKRLTPAGSVLISCFSNARMDPDSYQAFWQTMLRETSVDMLLFQDGVGTGKLSAELLPLYLKAVRAATTANGKRLQVVVEVFAMASESPFKATSAGILRVKQQLRVAAEYSTGGINSFSVPDYMSPEGGSVALELLNNYQKYKRGGQLTTPEVPAYPARFIFFDDSSIKPIRLFQRQKESW